MTAGDRRGAPLRWLRVALALVVLSAVGWLASSLVFRDTPQARIARANALLAAREFEQAQQELRQMQRVPAVAAMARQEEARLLASAERAGRADDWFTVGFYRDLRGDQAGAFAAFRTALHRGLAEPQATYARAAMERLAH